jgi:hypothetical protein
MIPQNLTFGEFPLGPSQDEPRVGPRKPSPLPVLTEVLAGFKAEKPISALKMDPAISCKSSPLLLFNPATAIFVLEHRLPKTLTFAPGEQLAHHYKSL